MNLVARNAWPTDDLAVLWPALGPRKLNLQQIMLVVDTEQDEAILGGVMLFDGGHEIVFVGEFTLVGPEAGKPRVAQYLMDQLCVWAQHEGKTMLMFHSAPTGPFLAHLLRYGARVAMAPMALVVMNTGAPSGAQEGGPQSRA